MFIFSPHFLSLQTGFESFFFFLLFSLARNGDGYGRFALLARSSPSFHGSRGGDCQWTEPSVSDEPIQSTQRISKVAGFVKPLCVVVFFFFFYNFESVFFFWFCVFLCFGPEIRGIGFGGIFFIFFKITIILVHNKLKIKYITVAVV